MSASVPALSTVRRKPYLGVRMEGPIAHWYAHITRNRREYAETARALASQLPAGAAVLEVAPGPGYLSIELARLGSFRITGLDISRSFVRIATDNAHRAGVAIDFQHGDVAHMPFSDNTFDFVVCQAAFKNFPEPVRALDDIHRVLRPGARASIFDLRKDAPSDAIEREIRDMHLSPLNAYLTRLTFRFGLLRAAYTRDRLESIVQRSRFGSGKIIADGIGFELRLEKPAA
jgi:ubiquinone/menaquinone biosynthesis C-methylase UbiE